MRTPCPALNGCTPPATADIKVSSLSIPPPGHPVADAELGEDAGGGFGIAAQLAADAADGGLRA